MKFLEPDGRSDEGHVVVIPVPLANTVSWQPGTDKGPEAILDASDTLELFDDELLQDTWKIGISTVASLAVSSCSSEEACRIIDQTVTQVLNENKFPVLIGGEHTVTVGAVAACVRQYPSLHVVQIDAHLDLRQTYDGTPLSHACVMRRIDDMGLSFSQFGIRSFSREEWLFVKERGLQPQTIHRIHNNKDWIEQGIAQINGPVYITIDVDGLDPSIMPATGTPEPDGLSFREVTALIEAIARKNQVIGMDCVEFSPITDGHHAAFTAAKLIYRALGYIFNDTLKKRKDERNF